MAQYRIKESQDQKLGIVSFHLGNLEEKKNNVAIKDSIFCVTVDNNCVLPAIQIYQSKPMIKLQDFQTRTIEPFQVANKSQFDLRIIQILNKKTFKIDNNTIEKGQVNFDLGDLIPAEGHQNELGSYLISFKYKTILKFGDNDVEKFLSEHNMLVKNKKESTTNLIKLIAGFALFKHFAS